MHWMRRTWRSIGRLLVRPQAVLFAVCWLAYGAMVNHSEMRCYGLLAAGTEAVVEYHTYEIGHSRDPWLRGAQGEDTFSFRGSRFRYSARQPGVATFGAAPYFVLHAAGLSFQSHYDRVYAVVAWTTAGLLTALAVGALYTLLRLWGAPAGVGAIAALAYGLATTAFPYTGVPHHDAQAAALLIVGFWLIERARNGGSAWLAGGVLGLVLFFSLLPALIVACVLVYVLITLPRRVALRIAVGFLVGLAPMLAYNWHYFGAPWRTTNVAGGFSDTLLAPSWERTWGRIGDYFGRGWLSTWEYEPVVPFGLIGLLLLPGRTWRVRLILSVAVLAHLAYVFNMRTGGHAQFGPRYLIPVLPLAGVGLSSWLWWDNDHWWTRLRLIALGGVIVYLARAAWRGTLRYDLWTLSVLVCVALLALSAGLRLARVRLWALPKDGLILALVLYGVVVNTVGALGNTSYAELDHFAFVMFLKRWESVKQDVFPLRPLCIALALVWLGLLALAAATRRRQTLAAESSAPAP
jgi:hypothetical protein